MKISFKNILVISILISTLNSLNAQTYKKGIEFLVRGYLVGKVYEETFTPKITPKITPKTPKITPETLKKITLKITPETLKITPKITPNLATPLTLNRSELWNVLRGDTPGETPKIDVFSKTGYYKPFTLESLYGNMSQHEGLFSGIYPPLTKVIGGVDDAGNKFFKFKHTFGPNQSLPFGTTPPKAKEVTFKNRFYYNQDPETGGLNVNELLGNPFLQRDHLKI